MHRHAKDRESNMKDGTVGNKHVLDTEFWRFEPSPGSTAMEE